MKINAILKGIRSENITETNRLEHVPSLWEEKWASNQNKEEEVE